jgi:outer membrane protein TolC
LPTATEFRLDESELDALSLQGLSKPDFSKIVQGAKEQPKRGLTAEEISLLEKELELLELIQSKRDNYNQEKQLTRDTYAQLKEIHQQILDELETDADSNDAKLQANREQTDFSEEDVIETAMALRLDLANTSDAVYDAERKIMVAEDNLRAGLNLTASTDFIHSPGKSDSIRGAGLELDLPLDQMAEANEYRKALIAFNQSQRAFEEAVDIVVLQVRQAYRDLTEAAEHYRVQLDSLKLAQKRFNNTLLLMQYGRASSRRVLNAQQDLFDAQNAATEALTNHAIAMLSFYRDTGVLQVKPDGMWKY